jgi:hypothetical protein
MSAFFPRDSTTFHLDDVTNLRRLSLSLAETAVLAGVALRLLRALWLNTLGAGWASLAGYYAVFAVVLLGAVAAHLANYTVRRWLWRAPLWAAVEATAEMLTSLALIAAHREPLGSGTADFHDWPSLALETLAERVGVVGAFALVLAGVVQGVRTVLARRARAAHAAHSAHR